MESVDILIKNGLIVTINKQMDVIPNGAIAIKDGRIIQIHKTENLEKKFSAKKIFDAESKIVMPGFINAHTHIPMTYFRGLADDLPLQEWLQNYIWPAEAKFVSEEFVYLAALHGEAELVKNGITMFNDMYFFPEQTAKAASKVGIRAIVGQGIVDFPNANYKEPKQALDNAVKYQKEFANNELINFAIAPHSIYSCSPETLQLASETAQKHNMLLHIHISETQKEVEDCLKQHHKRPLKYLNDIGFLDSNVVIAHGIWVDEEELNILKEKDISVAITTESNLKLASGFMPIKKYIEKGINLCLGTDGVASNNNLSILEEMDFTAKIHKAYNKNPTILPSPEVVKMATLNSAKALRKESELGSLKVGKKADIILIDTNKLELLPIYNVYSHLVYTISSNAICDVIIDGKLIMENRKLLTVDEDEIIDKAKFYKKKIKKVN